MSDENGTWTAEFTNFTVDLGDGKELIKFWWEDMSPREVLDLMSEAYRRGVEAAGARALVIPIDDPNPSEHNPDDKKCQCPWCCHERCKAIVSQHAERRGTRSKRTSPIT